MPTEAGHVRAERILDASIQAVTTVAPNTFRHRSSAQVVPSSRQKELQVLIGITGDVTGRLYISASKDAFVLIGGAMYGIALGEEMLDSFAAEFSNMVAGNMVQLIGDIRLDITPPTTITDQSVVVGLDQAISVRLASDSQDFMNLAFLIESA